MGPVLQAVELTKRFASVAAVQDVTFSLAPGQVLGCLGPNGSGKSTAVKMLTGLLEPSRGKVLFCGQNIQRDLVGYRKQLGYVPEEPNLYPYLTGREYLEMVENFEAAVGLDFAYYNSVKRHNTLRCTPAMAAVVERDFWRVGNLVEAAS